MAWSRGRARRGSTPTAGTPSGSRTATTSPRSRPPSRPPSADDRPSLIAVRTHIGFGSPNKQDTPEGARRAARPGRGPPHQGGLRLGPGPDVLRPRRGAASSSARRSPTGEALVADWEARLDALRATTFPADAAELRRRARRRGCPTAGTPASRRTRRAPRSRPGTRARTRSRRSRRRAARAVRRRRRPVRVQPDRRQGRAELRAPTSRAGTCASASASTAMGGDRQRHRLPRRVHPLLRHVPDLQRLHARRRSGWRRCPGSTSSTSGPTTRSASARTGRRTSRSSTTPRCGRSRTCGSSGRATPTRRPRPGRSPSSDATGRSRSRSPARSCRRSPGTAELAREGVRARRLRPARGGGRRRRELILIGDRARSSSSRSRRPRRSRRDGHPDARRVAALLGALRGPGPGVSRRGPAADRPQAGQRRDRRLARLGALGRRRGRDHRARPLRRVSAPAGTIFEQFGFTADRVADVGRRVVRDGLRGRHPDARRRRRTAAHPTLGQRRRRASTAPRARDPGHD